MMKKLGTVEEGLLIDNNNINNNRDYSSSSSTIHTAAGTSASSAVIFSTFAVACGAFAYGCGYGYSSPAEAAIMKELGLSTAQYSIFGSILTIGGMFGAIISGTVTDLIGRRRTMWLFQFFCILGWLSIISAKSALWLYMGRLSMGIGYGLYMYLAPVYIAEITPKEIRGACAAAFELTGSFGSSLIYFIGNFIHWRTLALIATIPCIVQVVCIFFIPESPRWLAEIGREEEVESTLQFLRGNHADISQESADIKDYSQNIGSLSKSKFLDLFKPKYAHSLIIAIGLMVMVQFGGANGISYYASSIFEVAGCSVSFGTTAMAITQIAFCPFSVLLMDRIGRRPLLMVTAGGACLGSLLTSLAFLFQDFHQLKEVTPTLVLFGILVYSASYSMGMIITAYVIMSEIFPMNIKGQAGSLVILAGWFSSWIVSYTFNFLFEWSSTGVFFMFAIVCYSLLLFTAKMVPETKGRTLEEIQSIMMMT